MSVQPESASPAPPAPGSAVTRPGTGATAAALTATLGLAAASWVVTVRQMNGMDMGVATKLGSFAFFAALWAWMMAAMMLPGAAPAVVRRAQAVLGLGGFELDQLADRIDGAHGPTVANEVNRPPAP